MSTSVIISAAKPIKIDLDDISGRKYYYGVRDVYDIVRRGEVGNYMVFFDFMKFGRGVEVTFMSKCKLEIRLNTPASTSDLELFMYLIKKMVKIAKVKELICEEEVYSVDALEKIREIVEANMQSGLDFVSRMSKENVEIIAVQGAIAIDDEERKQFADGQKELDKYLDSKQRLQRTNELLMPIVAETDGGAIWCLFLKAGRYIIVPRYARPRNKKMRINKYSVFYSGAERKSDRLQRFLKRSRYV